MKKRVYVIIDDKDDTQCSNDCSFLFGSTCLLFSKKLEDVILPNGWEWQDNVEPDKLRCGQCYYAF